jgi:hypothetical protein
LTRRGLALSAAALSGLLLQNAASAAVPVALADATIKAAMAYAVTGVVSAAVSAQVLTLSEGVLKGMFLTKLKIAAALVMITVIAGGAGISSVGLYGAASAGDAKGKGASSSSDTSKEKGPSAKVSQPSSLGKVTGRVVQAADSTPVAGADVRMLPRGKYPGQAPMRRANTNKNGEFTFNGMEPGEYRLWAYHGNLTSRTRMFQGEIAKVARGQTTKPIVLRLQPGISVRVKVLAEADGKPIAGARVRLIWTDTDRDYFTDDRGEVELEALTAETWHVEAVAKGHLRVTSALNLAAQQPASLELKLPPGGSVRGCVTDKDGRPIAGVGINAYPDLNDGTPHVVETDAEGRYRFDYLPLERTLKVFVRKLDYLPETPEFRIEATNGRLSQVDIVLKKRPHGGWVGGVVTDPQGKLVAGAEVFNRGGSTDEVRRAKTDAQGKFLLEDVYTDGIGHKLVVRGKGFAPQRLEFKPGPAAAPAAVMVKLEPGHRIKGRVVNEAGKPIPGVRVYFAHGNVFPLMEFGGSATTDAQGRFHFDSLPPDTPFTFTADGYSEIPEMRLPLDGDQEIDVQMKSQGLIKGRVVDAATLKPVPRFNIRITSSEDRQPDEPTTGLLLSWVFPGEDFVSTDGRFLLHGMMDGMPLQVTVNASGYRRQVLRRVVARAGAEAGDVEIRLTAEDPAKLATIRGKLVNHRGQPVRGAEVRLIVATDRPAQRDTYPFNWQMIESGQIDQALNVLKVARLTTGTDGSFVFERIPSDAEIELVYWGKGIPSGRVDHLETLPAKERASLEVKALAPARITGTIDRKVFPEIGMIQLSSSSRYFDAKVSADGKSFEIEDLPPGQYDLQLYGPSRRVPDRPGSSPQTVIGRRPVNLKEGQTDTVEFGKGDKGFN